MSLSGLPRLPGDDNFPATGSSWPGSRRAPSPGSRRWPCRPDGGWRRRQRVPGGPTGRPGGLRGPGAGEWKGSEEGAQAGPLTGAAGVVAASGSSAPGAGARSPPAPPPPPAAASAQWLGLGLGGSPESGLSRTPSPFFFVSTSSGTSCRLSRPTMAVRAAGPGPLPAGRPPCPLPAARSPRAVRVCSPRGSWPRPRPRPGRPRVRPARPQWQSPQARRQGPLRSRCAPPAAQPARSGGSPARGSPGRTLALPSPQPRRKRTRGPAHTGPRGRLVPPTPAQRALTPRALASGGSQRRAPARRGPGGRPNPESKQLEIINS